MQDAKHPLAALLVSMWHPAWHSHGSVAESE